MQGVSHRQNNLFYYQGKEKPEDGSLWDQFELRLYNHDLGRWFAPDPYGQFYSPYVGMGNNPASGVDPDGGYVIQAGHERRFVNKERMDFDRAIGSGAFDEAHVRARYEDQVENLAKRHGVGGNRSGANYNAIGDVLGFMEDLRVLNNEAQGLGLSGTQLENGQDYTNLNENILFASEIGTMARSLGGPEADGGNMNNWMSSGDSDPRSEGSWTRMNHSEREASGLSVGFTYFAHSVNGQFAGNYNTIGDAIVASNKVVTDFFRDHVTVEITTLSSTRKMGTTRTMNGLDYLNSRGIYGDAPTKCDGGFIFDKNAFKSFMGFMALTNDVEVSAYELQNIDMPMSIFRINPWDMNSIDESISPTPKDMIAFGFDYTKGEVKASYHTHPGNSGPSYDDAKNSRTWRLPSYTIGANNTYYQVYPKFLNRNGPWPKESDLHYGNFLGAWIIK